jgi:hypothetical protein
MMAQRASHGRAAGVTCSCVWGTDWAAGHLAADREVPTLKVGCMFAVPDADHFFAIDFLPPRYGSPFCNTGQQVLEIGCAPHITPCMCV